MTHVVLPAAEQHQLDRLRTLALYGAAAVGICLAWAGSLWVSQHVHPDPVLHEMTLFCHLACLLLGMGAVLTLDWLGLRWALGRLTRDDVLTPAEHCHTLIWAGLGGLVLTGMLLSPDLESPLTRIKVGAVLLVALNGLAAHALQKRLEREERWPLSLIGLIALIGGISQTGWWTAVVVGYYNSR